MFRMMITSGSQTAKMAGERRRPTSTLTTERMTPINIMTTRLPRNGVCLALNCIPPSSIVADYTLGDNIEVTVSFDAGKEAIQLGGSSTFTYDLKHIRGSDPTTRQVLSFVCLHVLR